MADPTVGTMGEPSSNPNPIVGMATQAIQQNPSGIKGFFAKLGQGIHDAAPQIKELGARLAEAGGNPYPMADLQRERANDLAQQRINEEAQTGAAHRQLLAAQTANIRSPEQTAAANLANSAAATTQAQELAPPTETTGVLPSGETGVFSQKYNPATQDLDIKPKMVTQTMPNPALSPSSGLVPNLLNSGQAPVFPPTPQVDLRSQLVRAPQMGFHLTGVGDDGNPVVQSYSKGGAPLGPPAPAPPSGKTPGMGSVDPTIAGQVGPMPNPAQFQGGIKSPEYKQALQTWAKSASDLKQSRDIAVANARGAAFGANRPIQVLGPDDEAQTNTMARLDAGKPGYTSPNQAGTAGISQKRATFAEVDQNLANINKYLPALDGMATGTKMAAALTPSTKGGIVGALGHGVEAAGLSGLKPDQQNLVFAIRNLRQGVLSLRNVLAAGGAGSDYKINVLESEMPNEADLLTGDPSTVARKMATFNSIYSDIIASYPQIFKGQKAPLTKPPIPNSPPTGGGGFADWQQQRQQTQGPH